MQTFCVDWVLSAPVKCISKYLVSCCSNSGARLCVKIFGMQLDCSLKKHIYLYLYLYATWQYALLCYRATGAITPQCGFFGGLAGRKLRLRPLRLFYVQLYSSVRRANWFTWFSEPHDTTSLHACPSVYSAWCVPGGHPSNYGPGPALLNFSDRANTDELTPYSV